MTGAGVLLLALVVGLTAGTIFLEKSKREAEENFRITREAAHNFLVTVNEEDLLNEPGMQPLRQKLLSQALDYYKEFLEKRPGDPIVRQEAQTRIGNWRKFTMKRAERKRRERCSSSL